MEKEGKSKLSTDNEAHSRSSQQDLSSEVVSITNSIENSKIRNDGESNNNIDYEKSIKKRIKLDRLEYAPPLFASEQRHGSSSVNESSERSVPIDIKGKIKKDRLEYAAPYASEEEGIYGSSRSNNTLNNGLIIEAKEVVAVPLSSTTTTNNSEFTIDIEDQEVVAVPITTEIEDRHDLRQTTTENSEEASSSSLKTDGKGIGYVMMATTIIALLTSFIPSFSWITMYICTVITLVLSSVISCKCCCGSNYKLISRTRRYAIVILTITIVQVLFYVIMMLAILFLLSEKSRFSYFISIIPGIISFALEILSLVLVCLYTFHR